ncbi:MAG: CoA transferase [Flavobacteriales bacterium]|nr:CoA transferase [Flavobacteriales bacterium]
MANWFSDLKVIEISSVLAGPAVGMFFAELGAKVIKVENKKQKGDVTRSWKLPSEDPQATVSAYFSSVNWNKEYLMMDFTNEADMEQCRALIAEADILISNFKFGDAKKFGLDYDSVKSINSTIIYGSISGFGPSSRRIAYDLILQAESGFMSMNGTPDSGPVKMPVAFIDLFAAHQLKEGILVALIAQLKEKRAYRVDVSLYDAALASLANQASNWLMGKKIPQRMGSKHPNIAPYGEFFETADGALVTFGIGSNKHFAGLCHELGLKGLIENPDYENNYQRVKHRDSLAKLIQEKVQKRESTDLIEKLISRYVPAAKIKDLKEVFEAESAKKLILEEEIENVPTQRVKTTIFSIEP